MDSCLPEPSYFMSYYQIINGVKYDRQLLEVAQEFVTGEGDGRISEREMKLIVKLAQDGQGVTTIERDTLFYIREHFNLTDAAAQWFDAQFLPTAPTDLQTLIHQIATDFQVLGLTFEIDGTEVRQQSQLAENQVPFTHALRATLQSFLTQGDQIESPRNLVMEVHQIFRENFESDAAWNEALTERVRAYMNEAGFLRLLPLEIPENKDDIDFNPPEDGESTRDNWIFQLALRTLSDHVFWAVTDRTGAKPTYNYGFN